MANCLLVPIDLSPTTDAVLDVAAALAKAMEAKIWAIHVVAGQPEFTDCRLGPRYVRVPIGKQFVQEHHRLREYEKSLADLHLSATAVLEHGSPLAHILNTAKLLDPSLIVVGSHGHGAMHHLLMGSICEAVLKHSSWPVMIVPARRHSRSPAMTHSILVPIDFSDITHAVLREAQKLAKALSAKVWLIHVGSVEPDVMGAESLPVMVRDSSARQLRTQHQKLQEYEKWLRDQGTQTTSMLVSGLPDEKILAECDRLKPDFVLMGSHGHGALHDLLMGSVCEKVLRRSKCPVVVVPVQAVKPAEKADHVRQM